jgi:outer membrane protein OmpA-like peptidoglycan-associated protein
MSDRIRSAVKRPTTPKSSESADQDNFQSRPFEETTESSLLQSAPSGGIAAPSSPDAPTPPKEVGHCFGQIRIFPDIPAQTDLGTPLIQRQAEDNDEMQPHALVQRSATDNSADASIQFESRLVANRAGGSPLSDDVRSFMEPRFGADFSQVRVHTNSEAVQMNRAIGAQAFTHGSDVYFNAGKYDPGSTVGKELLAHELTHVVQQGGSNQRIDRLADDPGRYETVHQNLFSNTPMTSGSTPQTWEANTPNAIIQQFKQTIQQMVDQRPLSVLGDVPIRTTEAEVDADAVQINNRITTRFSQITTRLSDTQVRDVVNVLPENQALDQNFMEQWVSNQMFQRTDIESYGVNEADPRFHQIVTTLIHDSSRFDFTAALSALRANLEARGWDTADIDQAIAQQRQSVRNQSWGWVLQTLASRTGAFTSGEGAGRQVSFSRGMSDDSRRLTLIHELVHFYAHPGYRDWVNSTTSPQFYNEGFTEYLARLVMTDNERSQRTSYQERVEAIEQQVAPYASNEDIASAYFAGEVWRLESQSQIAQQQFATQIGLTEGASSQQESAQAQSSPGIVQVIRSNYHYHFMNLGNDQADPKPEHEAFFQQLFDEMIHNNPNVRVRFVGHTSSVGSNTHNRSLSRRRAEAFYNLARRVGVPESQLFRTAPAEHEGESTPAANNTSVHGRAMNRRVDLFIIPQGSTRVEDNILDLDRLRGQGVDPTGMSMSHGLDSVRRNSPNPEQRLPFTSSGWDTTELLTRLGQYDTLRGTDSDSLRCVQAVALASHIQTGPTAVQSYLDAIVQQVNGSGRRLSNRQRTALQVVQHVQQKLRDRTATYGDLSWVQEAVHDLFYDDANGTPLTDILTQVRPNGDRAHRIAPMDVWCNAPADVMAQANALNPGEQLMVNTWSVFFNNTFDDLEEAGEEVHDHMQIRRPDGRTVWITRINADHRPRPEDIDSNRDSKRGHQLLIIKDTNASGTIRLYEPEITESGQHLATLTASGGGLERYFRELPDIANYDYVQILGKVIPEAIPTP